jgi:hypothetical protein
VRKDGWLLYPRLDETRTDGALVESAKHIENYCIDGAQDYGESTEFSNLESETVLFLCSGGVDEGKYAITNHKKVIPTVKTIQKTRIPTKINKSQAASLSQSNIVSTSTSPSTTTTSTTASSYITTSTSYTSTNKPSKIEDDPWLLFLNHPFSFTTSSPPITLFPAVHRYPVFRRKSKSFNVT